MFVLIWRWNNKNVICTILASHPSRKLVVLGSSAITRSYTDHLVGLHASHLQTHANFIIPDLSVRSPRALLVMKSTEQFFSKIWQQIDATFQCVAVWSTVMLIYCRVNELSYKLLCKTIWESGSVQYFVICFTVPCIVVQ